VLSAEANVPLLDVTPYEDSERSSADMDIRDRKATGNCGRYITGEEKFSSILSMYKF